MTVNGDRIPEPGNDEYPMAEFPEETPWTIGVDRAIARFDSSATPTATPKAIRPEYLAWEPEPGQWSAIDAEWAAIEADWEAGQ